MLKTISGLLLLTSVLWPQKLNGPAEILKILTDSRIHYRLDLLNSVLVDTLDYPLNQNDFYQKIDGSSITLMHYEYDSESQEFFNDAEKLYQKDDFAGAREMYSKVLSKNRNNSKIMTYIGQTYNHEANAKEAIKWYKKAVKANFIDYMAHWFLADAYFMSNKPKDALREIYIAHVLNRNNPRILYSLSRILQSNDLIYDDWSFSPQYELYTRNDTVIVNFTAEWLAYAMCKAAWQFEPNYRSDKIGSNSQLSSQEETECLANLVIAHENANGDVPSKVDAINRLSTVFKDKAHIEFIFYEIWMRPYPHVVFTQPEELIERAAKYFGTFHVKKKAG